MPTKPKPTTTTTTTAWQRSPPLLRRSARRCPRPDPSATPSPPTRPSPAATPSCASTHAGSRLRTNYAPSSEHQSSERWKPKRETTPTPTRWATSGVTRARPGKEGRCRPSSRTRGPCWSRPRTGGRRTGPKAPASRWNASTRRDSSRLFGSFAPTTSQTPTPRINERWRRTTRTTCTISCGTGRGTSTRSRRSPMCTTTPVRGPRARSFWSGAFTRWRALGIRGSRSASPTAPRAWTHA